MAAAKFRKSNVIHEISFQFSCIARPEHLVEGFAVRAVVKSVHINMLACVADHLQIPGSLAVLQRVLR
ncbi:MAG: hypothetical protein ACK55Z_04045, partial [bacterium]